MSSKIVIVGDINGRISEVFSKIASLHAKQSFAFAIIAGDLFSDPEATSEAETNEISQLLSESIEVPLPTYFAIGTHSLPAAVLGRLESNDGELCVNLTALGRRVSIKTSEGFRIVSIGGKHASGLDQSMNQYDATYTDEDVAALAKEFTDTDILVTSDWPAAIQDGSKVLYPSTKAGASIQSISDLCTSLKPRYHFSTSAAFYEREAFFHPGPSPRSISRFISLAPYGNAEKQKWIYAFSLEPSAPAPQALPQGCTASPFTSSKKRKLDSQQDSYNSLRYANGDSHQRREPDRGRGKRQRYQPPPTPDQCFFCLSNESCETHMIGSIGNDCYVTIAKGPLTTRSTFPQLGFSGHLLLIPLHHAPTIPAIPEKDAQRSTLAEMQRYRSALHDMLISKSKSEDGRSQLGAVTWEINRASGIHLHWQFIPVPVDLIQRGLVEAGFDVEAENRSYPKFAKTASEITEAEDGDYFKVMIWSEAMRKEMVLPIDQGFRFDLQFGRKVLAKLLGLDGRVDWRACAQDRSEEDADAAVFKEAFKEFDFSLEE